MRCTCPKSLLGAFIHLKCFLCLYIVSIYLAHCTPLTSYQVAQSQNDITQFFFFFFMSFSGIGEFLRVLFFSYGNILRVNKWADPTNSEFRIVVTTRNWKPRSEWHYAQWTEGWINILARKQYRFLKRVPNDFGPNGFRFCYFFLLIWKLLTLRVRRPPVAS